MSDEKTCTAAASSAEENTKAKSEPEEIVGWAMGRDGWIPVTRPTKPRQARNVLHADPISYAGVPISKSGSLVVAHDDCDVGGSRLELPADVAEADEIVTFQDAWTHPFVRADERSRRTAKCSKNDE